jgi:vanillate O-demethylase ferredoxin subunit
MSDRDQWTSARIWHAKDISPTIRLFEISPSANVEPWRPGAHIGVRVQCGERRERRNYSLLDLGRDDGSYWIAVKRVDDGLGGSRYMWSLAAGDEIEITQPEDGFELGLDAPAYVFLAGGIGVTPLLSMARKVSRRGTPLQFHYAVRSRDEAVFAELLRECLGDALHLHVSDEGSRLDVAGLVAGSREDAELYVCGPVGMLDTARLAWQSAGRQAANLRFESFGSGGHYANRPFTVSLPRYGLELPVSSHESILSALETAGVEILSGCRRGECGLCAVDILECNAPLDHRDVFLSDSQKAAGERLCTCVSRPTGGRIVIDTDYRGRDARTPT